LKGGAKKDKRGFQEEETGQKVAQYIGSIASDQEATVQM
jgi:hypothetical protein